jgi:hypothetical protein
MPQGTGYSRKDRSTSPQMARSTFLQARADQEDLTERVKRSPIVLPKLKEAKEAADSVAFEASQEYRKSRKPR